MPKAAPNQLKSLAGSSISILKKYIPCLRDPIIFTPIFVVGSRSLLLYKPEQSSSLERLAQWQGPFHHVRVE